MIQNKCLKHLKNVVNLWVIESVTPILDLIGSGGSSIRVSRSETERFQIRPNPLEPRAST